MDCSVRTEQSALDLKINWQTDTLSTCRKTRKYFTHNLNILFAVTKPHWHIIIARFFLLIQSAYLMKKCSFMFHRRENCLGSRSADYSCKTLCEFWEDLLNYWAVFKQVVRKYFRIHIPSVWLNFTFRQYTTTTAAVWKLLQNWKLRSSWFQTNIKQSCTTSKQLIWWRHRKYICRTTKQNICYLRLCLVSVGLFYPSHWRIHLI